MVSRKLMSEYVLMDKAEQAAEMRIGECDAILGEIVVSAEEGRYCSQLEYISQHMIMKGVEVKIDHFIACPAAALGSEARRTSSCSTP